MTCGAYKIENKVTGQVYVGSSKNIERAVKLYFSQLRNNKHPNGKLQNAWNEYKEENFRWEILDESTEGERDEVAQKYLDLLNSPEIGYNVSCYASMKIGAREIKKEDEIRRIELEEWEREHPFCEEKKLISEEDMMRLELIFNRKRVR